ncbi:MAG: C40 family peptidase [Clostridiaceae bacterium]|nr:C40 family peptidase [Clostridiaceae bacterium]
MDWYKEYRIVKDGDGYTVEIDLNKDSAEFSDELITNFKENLLQLDDKIYKLVEEKFGDIKVNSVKLMVGSLIVASVPFVATSTAYAAETTTQTTTQATSFTTLNTTGVVTANQLNMRSGPATTYSILHVLWLGNKVKVIGRTGDWYQIQLSDGSTGWVSKAYLQVDLSQQKIDTVINTAKSLIGTPYVWGGESIQEGGFDCSGFTQYVFSKAGYSLNRISIDQAKQGTSVTWANLKPGDLVFYAFQGDGVINHVGIYIGNGSMIHSPKTGDSVKTTDITTSYWQTRFVTARRIIS